MCRAPHFPSTYSQDSLAYQSTLMKLLSSEDSKNTCVETEKRRHTVERHGCQRNVEKGRGRGNVGGSVQDDKKDTVELGREDALKVCTYIHVHVHVFALTPQTMLFSVKFLRLLHLLYFLSSSSSSHCPLSLSTTGREQGLCALPVCGVPGLAGGISSGWKYM